MVLERNDVIDRLNNLNLPNDEYLVLDRAALVLHGVHYDTESIRIGCSDKLFEDFKKNDETKFNEETKSLELMGGQVILENIYNENSIEYMEDLPVANLESIRKTKKSSKLAEDKKDMDLIDKLMAILDTL